MSTAGHCLSRSYLILFLFVFILGHNSYTWYSFNGRVKMKNINSKEFKHFLKVEKETELLKKELEKPENLFSNLNLINDDVLMNLSDEDLKKVSNILDKI